MQVRRFHVLYFCDDSVECPCGVNRCGRGRLAEYTPHLREAWEGVQVWYRRAP